jgi:hypothetical protein
MVVDNEVLFLYNNPCGCVLEKLERFLTVNIILMKRSHKNGVVCR